MSLRTIHFRGKKVIKIDLEGINNAASDFADTAELTRIVNSSKCESLLLVNVNGNMPGNGYLEYLTETIDKRASQIRKAAVIGLNEKNQKMHDYYDKFNRNKIDRKAFPDIVSALVWLTE